MYNEHKHAWHNILERLNIAKHYINLDKVREHSGHYQHISIFLVGARICAFTSFPCGSRNYKPWNTSIRLSNHIYSWDSKS